MDKVYFDIYDFPHRITKELSRGGQGVVYKTQIPNIVVKVEIDSKTKNEKKDSSENEKYNKIRLLPIPNGTKVTLPQATLRDCSGYVMTLLEDMSSFKDAFYDNEKELYLNEWLNLDEYPEDFIKEYGGYIRTGGKRRRLLAYLKSGIELSKLHMNSLVYCDFSDNNVFISTDQNYTNVWLIDADNINYQKTTKKGGFLTPGYAAPELYQGVGCTMYSDIYSYLIALFWQLTNNHPFDGLYKDEYDGEDYEEFDEIKNRGELPFILDEDEDGQYNPTYENYKENTQIHQGYLLSREFIKIFEKAFSYQGKVNMKKRPTIFQINYEIAKELDKTIKCSHCEMEYTTDFEKCPWCDNENKVINIKSYYYNEDKVNIMWKFCQEIEDKKTKYIPTRLSQGYKADEIDDVLFNIALEDNKLKISNFNYKFEFKKFDTKEEMYGEYIVNTPIKILCNEKKSKDLVLLEVNVECN
ncbi:MAG: protein kinase domain-containing protein [Clostridium sp.]